MTDESAAIVLQRLVDSGKLSGADVAIMEETMKRDKIAKIHNHKIRHTDNQIDTEGNECDVKKKSKAGHRKLPISEFAWSILNQLPKDGEYILMKDNKVLNTDSFNARLKKRCKECGVRYLSSHKIRFSNCTTLLENGVDIREVQYAMGHTEQRMTEHYNRPCPNKAANPMISTVLTKGVTYV